MVTNNLRTNLTVTPILALFALGSCPAFGGFEAGPTLQKLKQSFFILVDFDKTEFLVTSYSNIVV